METTDIKYCSKCGEKISTDGKCFYCTMIDRIYDQLEELVGKDVPCIGYSHEKLRFTLFFANGEKLELDLCWS